MPSIPEPDLSKLIRLSLSEQEKLGLLLVHLVSPTPDSLKSEGIGKTKKNASHPTKHDSIVRDRLVETRARIVRELGSNKIASGKGETELLQRLKILLDEYHSDDARVFIPPQLPDENKPDPVIKLLAEFVSHVRANPDQSPERLAQSVASKIASAVQSQILSTAQTLAPPLPNRAPELWAKRKNKDEIPPEFATRVYRVWMDAEVLTRPDLKRLDPQLFSSLDNWLKHNRRKAKPDPLPEGFKLLTMEQSNDTWVSKVLHGQIPLPTDKDELARFAVALYDRARGPRTK